MTQPGDVSWLRLLLAIVVTLGLLAGLAGVLKYLGMRGLSLPGTAPRQRRLRLIESLPIDTRRRAVIIACDGQEHLVLLGAGGDTVVQANLPKTSAFHPSTGCLMLTLPTVRHALSFILALLVLILLPGLAQAQSINFDMGQGPSATAHIVQTVMLVTVLSLAPSILVMVTSFTRIIVVLSFLRTALGTQTTPPNIVLISLALFLTMFIMQPTFDLAWDNGIKPMMDNQLDEMTAFQRTLDPFRDFMLKHTRPKDIALFTDIAKANDAAEAAGRKTPAGTTPTMAKPPAAPSAAGTGSVAGDDISIRALIPAFMISELRRAFEIGFLLFMPFLIIDMVVASILMAMGMMMLPPSIISLPFKIIFFVLVDGWYLISGSLIQSYGS